MRMWREAAPGLPESMLAAHQTPHRRLPERERDRGAKKSEGRVCLRCPLGEEVEDRKYRAPSQAASQKAWASCLSQPGPSGHVSSSCPQKTNQALCREPGAALRRWSMATLHQQVAHSSTSEFILGPAFLRHGTVEGA